MDADMGQPSTPLEGTSPRVQKDAIMVSGAKRQVEFTVARNGLGAHWAHNAQAGLHCAMQSLLPFVDLSVPLSAARRRDLAARR